MCLVAQSCLILCDSMDCSPPGFFAHGHSPGKNSWSTVATLQGIFPTQGSNPRLPYRRWILYTLSHCIPLKAHANSNLTNSCLGPLLSVLVAHLCPTLCEPMDWGSPGSSVHGIFQSRILEWVAIPFFRDLPNPGVEPGLVGDQADSIV